MKIEEDVNIGPFNGEYTIMVSSSVNGFETQLNLIFTYLTQLGFNVVMSKEGTLKVSPRLGSFGSCLKAVEDCDLFFGIIRKNCGTGRMDECSITFEEFKRARKCGKPCVIGANSVVTHNLPDYCVAVGIPAKIIKRYNFETQQWEKTDK